MKGMVDPSMFARVNAVNKFKKECKGREVIWTCFHSLFVVGGDLGYRPDLDRIGSSTDATEESTGGKLFGRICCLASIMPCSVFNRNGYAGTVLGASGFGKKLAGG